MGKKIIAVSAALAMLMQLSFAVSAAEANSNVYDGYASLKFVNTADTPYKMFSQSNITVEPNTEYTAEIWVKGNKCAKLRILNSATWKDLDQKVEKTLSGSGDEWVKNEITFNTGSADKVTFTIATDTYNRGTAYFDSAALYKVGSDENILPNPSMEDNGYKWGSWTDPFFMEQSGYLMEEGAAAPGNIEKPSPAPSDAPTQAPSEQYNVYDGYTSLKFVNTADTPYKMFSQSNISVEPNTDYTAEIWVKGNKCAKLRILDSTTWKDLDQKVEKTLSGNGDEWIRNEVTFNTGSASKITFTIATDTYNRGTAYFDSAAIYKVGSDENILIDPSMENSELKKWGSWTDPFFMEQSKYLMEEGAVAPGNIEKPSPAPSDAPTQAPSEPYNVYDGYTSLKFVNTADSAYKMFSQSNISVEPDTDYTAEIWVKGNKCAKLRILDSTTWKDLDQKVEKTLSGNGDEWIKNEVTFNTGSASKITFTIATDTYNRGTAYFDNAAIYKVGSDENILTDPSMENSELKKWGSWTDPFFMEKSDVFMSSGVPSQEPPVVSVKVNGVDAEKLQTGKYEISVENPSGILIASIYRNGVLYSCSVTDLENDSPSSAIETTDEDTELKIMVWNPSNMEPLTQAISLTK